MKTISISISEFENLIARNDWQREQDCDVVERLDRSVESWDEESQLLELVEIPHVWGWASKTSIMDGIKITYTEGFDYDECEPDSLSVGTEGQDDVWELEGVVVVDEDGDEIDAHELADYLDCEFSSIDYSVLEIEQTDTDIDIDIDEDKEMEIFTLDIDNQPSLRFCGELLASAASSASRAVGSYSGQTGRWTELELYITESGKYICHKIGRTIWAGERDRHSGKVCETLEEVKDFFGHRWLAKDLYADAGIDDAIEV